MLLQEIEDILQDLYESLKDQEASIIEQNVRAL